MKIAVILLQLFLVFVLSITAYGAENNNFIEADISTFDNSSVFYLIRGLEKAEKENAQGFIITMHDIPVSVSDKNISVTDSQLTLLSKLTDKLRNSKIPVIISAENSNIETYMLILYISGDITISDAASRFGGTRNLRIDGELPNRYDSIVRDTASTTDHNYAIASALAHNIKTADASTAAGYGITDIVIMDMGDNSSRDRIIISALAGYKNQGSYIRNKNPIYANGETKIIKLKKDWVDNMQSLLDKDNPTIVWIDLLLWVIILGALIIFAPFLLPVLNYIIPLIAVIISGIIFLGTPQAHDAVYSILGVLVGAVLIAIDVFLFGSILLSLVGMAIVVYSILLLFGVQLFDPNFTGGFFVMNNLVITSVTVVIILIAIVALLIYLAAKSQVKPKYNGNITMIGKIGNVIDFDERDGRYKIHIEDEIWYAVSDDILFANEKVEVIAVEDLILKVKKNELV